jgi:hypothetical protein
MHAATSKAENSAQGLSCKLKFFHAHRRGMEWGARKQTGENLKVAWAKFSTVKGCFYHEYNSMAYASTPTPKVENSAQVLSC